MKKISILWIFCMTITTIQASYDDRVDEFLMSMYVSTAAFQSSYDSEDDFPGLRIHFCDDEEDDCDSESKDDSADDCDNEDEVVD